MSTNLNYRIAQVDEELNEILALQSANHYTSLSPSEKNEQGFLTVRHSLAQLQAMALAAPQFIAFHESKLAGYVLTMTFDMKATVPSLAPLFEEFEEFSYNDLKLSEQPFVVCGQTCIHRDFRGMGIMHALYNNMSRSLSSTYKGCITEISELNQRSLKAHAKIGFEIIHTYFDGQQHWNVVLWQWGQA